jgi:hypothetical protein
VVTRPAGTSSRASYTRRRNGVTRTQSFVMPPFLNLAKVLLKDQPLEI